MKKIRIAFILNLDKNWLGGVNYFKNLLNILLEDKNINIEPFVFVSSNCDMNLLKDYPNIKIIKTKILKRYSFYWFINKIFNKSIKWDILLELLLKYYKIDIVSHLLEIKYIKSIYVLGWIPDFQHKYLKNLFSNRDILLRDKLYNIMAEKYNGIILSSKDAECDFKKFLKYEKTKTYVLQFVVPFRKIMYNRNYLSSKYGIEGNFFYVPNQFWQHKNHKIILEALNYLKDTSIVVYSTGNTNDYRNKNYFFQLLSYIKKYKLEKKFKILGAVPYKDVQILMMECKAVINPSLFEGWSTTVEEAKSLGKRIILSDIKVHKEQNPEGGVFFKKNEAKDLADKMLQVWNESGEVNKQLEKNAVNDLNRRKNILRKKYYNIINDYKNKK